MSTINILGPVGYNPTGNYDPTRTYEKLDVVYYQGSSYVAISDSLGQLPTNSEYWNCIATGALKQFTYDSVAEMKIDNSLEDGMYVNTVGYYSANDGGGATYKITDTESQTEYQEELNSGLYATLIFNDYVTPEMFGAKGDGTTDDSTILQYILDNTYSNVPIKFNKLYKVSVGLSSNKPRNIYSEKPNCGLTGNTADYILKFEKDNSDSADYRNNFIKNIVISQSGTGNALQFSGWGDYLMELKIENCKISTPYTNATGYAIFCSNSLAHSIIRGCNIQGNGIYGELRDANVIQKNLIFGKGTGIRLDIPNGCLNNTIKDNTIVTHGGNAIYIANGEQILIDNNQIEYGGSSAQTSATKGMLYMAGNERRCKHVIVTNNNFGGGTHLDCLIWLANTDDVIIDKNRLVACNNEEIHISSGSQRTIVRDGNYGVSQESNPRTDKDRRYLITDNGLGTMGTWRKILIQESQATYLEYKKTEDGFMHFKPVNIVSLTNLTLCQLPLYYRPNNTVCSKALSYDGTDELTVKISYDGTITLSAAPSTQKTIFIQSGYEVNRYA